MRLLASITALSLVALMGSAQAQTVTAEQADAAIAAIEEFELSDELYQNLWCGAAFQTVITSLTAEGKTEDAASVEPLLDKVFENAATEAIANEISEDDFANLSGNFAILVMSQTTENGGEAEYTQEECVAVAQ